MPNTVEIKVTERVAQYAVNYNGQYAYINTQGYILEIAHTSNNMPIIQGATTKEDEFKPGKRLCDDINRLRRYNTNNVSNERKWFKRRSDKY